MNDIIRNIEAEQLKENAMFEKAGIQIGIAFLENTKHYLLPNTENVTNATHQLRKLNIDVF